MARSPQRSGGRHPGKTLLFVVILGLLVLGVVEGGLRLARRWHGGLDALLYSPTVRTEYDEVGSTAELLSRTVLGHRPGEVRGGFVLNRHGFRTPEYSPEPAPGRLRVVVLADSFAFSRMPWSGSWPTLLEAELADRLESPVEVINLAVPAVGPRFYLRMWELEGARLSPDVVLLAFFVGNDFTDESGIPLVTRRESGLAHWSETWRLVRNAVRLLRERKDGKLTETAAQPESRSGPGSEPGSEPGSDPGPEPGTERPWYRSQFRDADPELSEDEFLRIEEERLRLVDDDHRRVFERLFADAREVLARLHRSVQGNGARLVMVVIPDEFQVSPELLRQIEERFEIDPETLDLTLPQRRLASFCREEGLACVDLLPLIEAEPGRVYRLRDTHWNAAGNRLAAEALADFLAEEQGVRRRNSARE